MKILYLLKGSDGDTLKDIMDAHAKKHEVAAVDLAKETDYAAIVAFIESSHKIISW